MTEEKEHEHVSHETKSVTIKKSTLWGIGVFVLLALLVASIFTNGFGIIKSTGSATNTGANTNTGTQAPTTMDTSMFTSDSSLYPSLGPNNAKTTVIEFADFQCPVCGLASGLPSWTSTYTNQPGYGVSKAVEQLAQQGKVRFIFVTMNFLDRSSTPAGSTFAGEAGLCANEQGKFWEMHDIIYTNQVPPAQEGTQFTKSQLETMAQGVTGLDQTKFKSCLESDKYLSAVQQSNNNAGSAGVGGTPTFVVNGQIISNWASTVSAISAA